MYSMYRYTVKYSILYIGEYMKKTIAAKAKALIRKHNNNVSVALKGKKDFEVVRDTIKDGNLYSIFSDGSALVNKYYGTRNSFITHVDYYWEMNDRNVNQGFPVKEIAKGVYSPIDKKLFVESAVITVMWDDDKNLDLCLIVEMDKRPHNFKGDFDIKVFSLKSGNIHRISQTQIKKLVAKNIGSYLPEELYQVAYNGFEHDSF